MRRPLLLLVVLWSLLAALTGAPVAAQDTGPVRTMVFPVIGEVSWTDTFGAPRSSGRTHEGQDLLGHKMQELVAAADGRITYVTTTGSLAGVMLELTDAAGWRYTYLHINNDTPGTDDGAASPSNVFGPGIALGATVVAGQLLGYMGDSGNAESTAPHLHFELTDPTGQTVNAAASLQAARTLGAAVGAPVSPIARLAGADRVATAVAVSQAGWPSGSADVVVAAGDRYAEALPATVLAGARSAPLLLTVGSTPSALLLQELQRLGAARITVVGSVPDTVVSGLAASGRTVTRVGVAGDSVATAVAVAHVVGGAAGVAVLVNGDRFADGVSATALAAGRGWPVLLTTASRVPQATVDAWRALGVNRLVIVGGTSVVGANIESFVATSGRCAGAIGCTVERLAGPDRYATSVAVVERSIGLGGRSASHLLLGTGASYPDALASGPLASRLGGIALLVDGTGSGADGASRAFLAEQAAVVEHVSILGGSVAVTGAADRAVQAALGL